MVLDNDEIFTLFLACFSKNSVLKFYRIISVQFLHEKCALNYVPTKIQSRKQKSKSNKCILTTQNLVLYLVMINTISMRNWYEMRIPRELYQHELDLKVSRKNADGSFLTCNKLVYSTGVWDLQR